MSRAEAMARAFAGHERDHHGATEAADVPFECYDDVAHRYDQIRIASGRARLERFIKAVRNGYEPGDDDIDRVIRRAFTDE